MPSYRLWSDTNQAGMKAELTARGIPFEEFGWALHTEIDADEIARSWGASIHPDDPNPSTSGVDAWHDIGAFSTRSNPPAEIAEPSPQQNIASITQTIGRGKLKTTLTPRRATRRQPL